MLSMASRLTLCTGVLLCLAAGPVLAAEDVVDPRNLVPSGGARSGLTLSMTKLDDTGDRSTMRDGESAVAIGDKVKVCFESGEAGFITLWSHDAEGGVARILPNQYTQGGTSQTAIELPPGQRYCVAENGLAAEGGDGSDTARWWFEVSAPAGKADLYLHWTRTEADQLPDDSFVDVDALGRAVTSRDAANYSSAWFSYQVNQ